jgi:hypothetical protein
MSAITKELEMEAYACIWEWVIETLNDTVRERMPLDEYREGVGMVQLRHDMMPFAEHLHNAYLAATPGQVDSISFDWEFTPWFCENCISWSSMTSPTLRPHWRKLVHRDWGEFDNDQARSEGWYLCPLQCEIRSYGFNTDHHRKTLVLVLSRARNGSKYHQRALSEVRKTGGPGWERIRDIAFGMGITNPYQII